MLPADYFSFKRRSCEGWVLLWQKHKYPNKMSNRSSNFSRNKPSYAFISPRTLKRGPQCWSTTQTRGRCSNTHGRGGSLTWGPGVGVGCLWILGTLPEAKLFFGRACDVIDGSEKNLDKLLLNILAYRADGNLIGCTFQGKHPERLWNHSLVFMAQPGHRFSDWLGLSLVRQLSGLRGRERGCQIA